jgi:hypothetical protein
VVEEGQQPMMRGVVLIAAGLLLTPAAHAAAVHAQAPPDSVPIVAVSGCLTERAANGWALTNATEPTPSIANAPSPNTPIKEPTTGKNEFALIGVSEFDLPAHKGHMVLVKALLIKAAPVSRLNVTSITHIAPTCPPPAK